MIKRVIKVGLPPHTRRWRAAKAVAAKLGLAKPLYYDIDYDWWMRYVEPEMFLPVVASTEFKNRPLFSIVIPFFNTPDKYLHPLIDSILGQSFDSWELIIGDGSSDPKRSAAIKEVSNLDPRLKYHKFTRDTDISGNTNQALTHASGQYIVFCDHDDTLSPHALNEVAAKIADNEQLDIIYSDEDKLSDDGKWRHHPFFKPKWSPHLFLQTNYTNHLSVIRRTLVEKAGGLRSEFNGAQDYDLLLRIHSLNQDIKVGHVNKILYHWREAEGSTAANFDSKSYAFEAGRKALQEYLDRMKIKGKSVTIPGKPGFYRQELEPNHIKRAKIIVALSDNERYNQAFVDKLAPLTKTNSLDIEYATHKASQVDTVSRSKESDQAVFVFKSFALPQSIDWLDRLVGVLELSNVSQVAPRILSSDSQKVVDMGKVVDSAGETVYLHKGQQHDDMTLNGHVEWVRDVDGLTGAVVGYRGGSKSGAGNYSVVWSHINFRLYNNRTRDGFLNSNLINTQDNTLAVYE